MPYTNYLLVKSASQYEANNYFLEDILAEAKASGSTESVLMDCRATNGIDKIANYLIRNPETCVINFNGALRANQATERYQNKTLPELLQKTHFINWYLDPPAHLHDRHVIKTQGIQSKFFIDPSHISYINAAYPHIKNHHFVPHGCSVAPSILPYTQREIPILVCGSYQQPQKALQLIEDVLGNQYKSDAYKLIDLINENPKNDVANSALSLFKDKLNPEK